MTSPIPDKELSEYNQQGLIPGPDEPETEFQKRVDYCLNIREHLADKTGVPLPSEKTEEGAPPEEAIIQVKELYDISPEWVPVIYDNHKLSLWHGGCAWIFQCDEDSPLSAMLQLRKSLKVKENIYGFLNKKEIVSHELCHVGRMAFEEPLYEELFAYRTSESGFRKWLGPIVKNSIESGIFVLILFMIFLLDLFVIYFGSERALSQLMWLKVVPLLLIGYGLLRLKSKHRRFNQCLNNLEELCQSKSKASAVAYRLTDKEVDLFSRWSSQNIREYIEEQKELSLRWRMINFCYFSFSI